MTNPIAPRDTLDEPVAKVINNNQPGWTNIIETKPNVTLLVGIELYTKAQIERLINEARRDELERLSGVGKGHSWSEYFTVESKYLSDRRAQLNGATKVNDLVESDPDSSRSDIEPPNHGESSKGIVWDK